MKIETNTHAPTDTFDTLAEIPLDCVDNGVLLIDNDGDAFVVGFDYDREARYVIGLYGRSPSYDAYVSWPARRAPAGFSITLTQEA